MVSANLDNQIMAFQGFETKFFNINSFNEQTNIK